MRHASRALIALLPVLSAAACGDDRAIVEPVRPVPGDGGAPRVDGGDPAPPKPPPPPPPPAGACPTPPADALCTLPADAAGQSVHDAWMTSTSTCAARLYVAVDSDSPGLQKVRRYDVTSVTPSCTLTRDTAFGEIDGDYAIAADDAGTVYGAGWTTDKIRRLAPGAPVDCTLEGIDTTALDAADVHPFDIAIARDGKVGYVMFAERASGKQPFLAKLVPTATGCTVSRLATTGGPTLSGMQQIAIDTKGRIHVADDVTGDPGNAQFVIYDGNGAFVSTYATGADGKKFFSANGVTACQGGMCLDTFATDARVSVDGAFYGEADFQPKVGLNLPVRVGAPETPAFVVGTAFGTTGGIVVHVLRAR